MVKKAFDSVKKIFGVRSGKQIEFDDAVLLILKAVADSRLYLSTQETEQLDSSKGKEIAHAWSESAVKINRMNDNLREDCLALAKAFSVVNSWNSEQNRAALDQVDTIFNKTCGFLREGAKLF